MWPIERLRAQRSAPLRCAQRIVYQRASCCTSACIAVIGEIGADNQSRRGMDSESQTVRALFGDLRGGQCADVEDPQGEVSLRAVNQIEVGDQSLCGIGADVGVGGSASPRL